MPFWHTTPTPVTFQSPILGVVSADVGTLQLIGIHNFIAQTHRSLPAILLAGLYHKPHFCMLLFHDVNNLCHKRDFLESYGVAIGIRL